MRIKTTKRALGAIVATMLLLLVGVGMFISIQSWYETYQSQLQTNIIPKGEIEIIGLKGDILYVRNYGSLDLIYNSIKINGFDCNMNSTLEGSNINLINLSDCLSGVSEDKKEILIFSNEGIFNKIIYNKVNSFINPSSFSFFRVNEDHQNDFDADTIDKATNYNGQSCLWKVYFDNPNQEFFNYDIIENSVLLMTINSSEDCLGGFCRKTIDKCESSYDNILKTAYLVESGEVDISDAKNSSFTNNCISNGYGDDGWDNDCDRNFDENQQNNIYNCKIELLTPNATVGESYTCPDILSCESHTANFYTATAYKLNNGLNYATTYSDSSCTNTYSETSNNANSLPKSGNVPSCGFNNFCVGDTDCHIYSTSNSIKGTGQGLWDGGLVCYYDYWEYY